MGSQAQANPRAVLWGTLAVLAVAAVPLAFKEVRKREMQVVVMRDSQLDDKDAARDARLRTRRE